MTFILSEDKALKTKLAGITVTDTEIRPVPVYYRLPESEVRAQTYPYITIDMVNIGEDTERTHRGNTILGYTAGANGAPGTYQKNEFPTPYFLDYQVTTYARFAQHDRSMLATLLTADYLPHHFGYLEVPEDGTIRRLDLMGIVNGDVIDQNQKRLFRKIFNIRVSSELFLQQATAVQEVLSLNLTLGERIKLTES